MAGLAELDLKPDARKLRQFGFIALAGFGLLAVLAWNEAALFSFGLGSARTLLSASLAALGLFAGLASLVAPRTNLPLYLGITLIAYPIGLVLSYLLLALLFYGVITPVGFVVRTTGRDPMARGFSDESSYWSRNLSARTKESYFRQY